MWYLIVSSYHKALLHVGGNKLWIIIKNGLHVRVSGWYGAVWFVIEMHGASLPDLWTADGVFDYWKADSALWIKHDAGIGGSSEGHWHGGELQISPEITPPLFYITSNASLRHRLCSPYITFTTENIKRVAIAQVSGRLWRELIDFRSISYWKMITFTCWGTKCLWTRHAAAANRC